MSIGESLTLTWFTDSQANMHAYRVRKIIASVKCEEEENEFSLINDFLRFSCVRENIFTIGKMANEISLDGCRWKGMIMISRRRRWCWSSLKIWEKLLWSTHCWTNKSSSSIHIVWLVILCDFDHPHRARRATFPLRSYWAIFKLYTQKLVRRDFS